MTQLSEPEIHPPLVFAPRPVRTYVHFLKAFLPAVLETWEAALDGAAAASAGIHEADAETAQDVFSYMLSALWRQVWTAIRDEDDTVSLRLRLEPDVRRIAAGVFRRVWDRRHEELPAIVAKLGPEMDAFVYDLIAELGAA